MKSEWKEIKFGDFVKIKRGHDLPKTKMNDGQYPVVGSNGIIGFHNEYTTPSPSLTIGRSGNIGKPFYLEKETWSHNTTLYVEDFLGNDPYFVYNFLKIMRLNEFAGGSAVPTLNRNHINPLLINIPSKEIQIKIGKLLKNIDKKIEVNNKINNNLEQLAESIFKNWFINCELFVEENFIVHVWTNFPESWTLIKLKDIINITSGKRPGDKEDLKKGEILKRINYDAYNTGSTQPLITQKAISNIEIPLPPSNELNKFEKISSTIYSEVYKNNNEIETLTKLRDTLLPKLMSGEIDVSEINFD